MGRTGIWGVGLSRNYLHVQGPIAEAIPRYGIYGAYGWVMSTVFTALLITGLGFRFTYWCLRERGGGDPYNNPYVMLTYTTR